jgi:predicted RNase H-like HicB family nuclease
MCEREWVLMAVVMPERKVIDMFAEYIAAALERANYEIVDDPEPYYASVPGLPGVWATGKTFEECRRELISTIEGWIVLGLRMGHPIPPIDGQTINWKGIEFKPLRIHKNVS